MDDDLEWKPIETAPKDGTLLFLTAFDEDGEIFEIHLMRWAHIQRNGLFPDKTGMWTHPSGDYTWNDDGRGGGPTHWAGAESRLRMPTAEELNRAVQRLASGNQL